MYAIKWLPNAKVRYSNTLLYWNKHNKSNLYSLKIREHVREITRSLKDNPFLMSRFLKQEGVYRRIFLKGKFSIYFEIKENTVYIVHFQSNSQEPIY